MALVDSVRWWLQMAPRDRAAWLRSLQTAIRLIAGPAGENAAEALKAAEGDQSQDKLISAAALLEQLPTLTLRRVISTAGACLPRRP